MLRVGTAGWLYKDWNGTVYPAPKPRGFDPLGYLASYFDVVEVNSSFYGPPKAATARDWVKRVADNPDFRFTSKLWRRFTHDRKTAWTRADVKEARAAPDALLRKDRLAAVVMQFPWSFRNVETSREWLGDLTAAFEGLPLVVEVRHSSWMENDFFRELLDRGVGFVNIDQPIFSDSVEPSARATSGVAYVRIHGRNYQKWWKEGARPHERYDYLYSAAQLKPWVERVGELREQADETVVILNNHYRGQAPANALMVSGMVEGKQVPSPPLLFETYRKVLEPFARPVEAGEAQE